MKELGRGRNIRFELVWAGGRTRTCRCLLATSSRVDLVLGHITGRCQTDVCYKTIELRPNAALGTATLQRYGASQLHWIMPASKTEQTASGPGTSRWKRPRSRPREREADALNRE